MKATGTAQVSVESGGNRVAAPAGPHAPGSFPDRLGPGTVISNAIVRTAKRLRCATGARSRSICPAGGGESRADIEHLRAQRLLFPDGCSDFTLYRSVRQLNPEVLPAGEEAVAQVRAAVWRRMPSVWRNEGLGVRPPARLIPRGRR